MPNVYQDFDIPLYANFSISTGIAYIGHFLREQVLWENMVGISLIICLQDERIVLQEAADEVRGIHMNKRPCRRLRT